MSFMELSNEQREIDAVCRNFHKSLHNSYYRGIDVSAPAFADVVSAIRSNAAKLPESRREFWNRELEHMGIV